MGAHDSYYREHLLPLAAHGDGHILDCLNCTVAGHSDRKI